MPIIKTDGTYLSDSEAGAKIERLRAENERLRGHIYASGRPQPEEIERLRAALQQIILRSEGGPLSQIAKQALYGPTGRD